jgi:hypothetical protein
MNDQVLPIEVLNTLTEQANKRNEAIASDVKKKPQSKMDHILFTLLECQSSDGSMFYGLQLPRCFPSMTRPDILSILVWHVREGLTIRGGTSDLMEVRASYGDIELPMPRPLRGSRVVHIVKKQGEQIQMGDLLVIFQARANQPQKTARQNAA